MHLFAPRNGGQKAGGATFEGRGLETESRIELRHRRLAKAAGNSYSSMLKPPRQPSTRQPYSQTITWRFKVGFARRDAALFSLSSGVDTGE
jgi:hypothetical protein